MFFNLENFVSKKVRAIPTFFDINFIDLTVNKVLYKRFCCLGVAA